MGKKYEQMSLLETYKSIEERLENNKPELFLLLDKHLDWEEIIPARFYRAFYRRLDRKREVWSGEFSSSAVSPVDLSLCGRFPAAQHTSVQL